MGYLTDRVIVSYRLLSFFTLYLAVKNTVVVIYQTKNDLQFSNEGCCGVYFKPSLSHYLAVLLIVSVGADGSPPKQTTRSAGTAARFGICTKYSSSTLALASQNFVLPDVCLTAYPKKSLISTHLSKVQIRQHQHALVCPHHRRLPPSDDGNRAQPANCGRLPKRSLFTPNSQCYIPRRKIFQT
jgi:hypothetical protein